MDIDGTTQPGYSGSPLIVLNSRGAAGTDGLDVTASGCTIKALAIDSFAANGILLEAGASSNAIERDDIGTDAAGSLDLGNALGGVAIDDGATGQTRSAAQRPAAGNTIADNGGAGVVIIDASTIDNSIRGNAIFDNSQLGIDLGGDGVTPRTTGTPWPPGRTTWRITGHCLGPFSAGTSTTVVFSLSSLLGTT